MTNSLMTTIYTIGHSTRSGDDLLELLSEAGVRAIADVRAFPSSRRHPQYNAAALRGWLPRAGIRYVHVPELGGRRRPLPNSVNRGWREPAFTGYADHMSTREFSSGLHRLTKLAGELPTAVMCAEALWWRCHRRLIADALTAQGWTVEHLGIGDSPTKHEMPDFAVVQNGNVVYPPPQLQLP